MNLTNIRFLLLQISKIMGKLQIWAHLLGICLLRCSHLCGVVVGDTKERPMRIVNGARGTDIALLRQSEVSRSF